MKHVSLDLALVLPPLREAMPNRLDNFIIKLLAQALEAYLSNPQCPNVGLHAQLRVLNVEPALITESVAQLYKQFLTLVALSDLSLYAFTARYHPSRLGNMLIVSIFETDDVAAPL